MEQPERIRQSREKFENLDLAGLNQKLLEFEAEKERLTAGFASEIQVAQVDGLILDVNRRIDQLIEMEG